MNGIRGALLDAVIAALPVAIVFFSGWAYLTSYLGEFGVDATEVTVPLPTVLVYAFTPLQSARVLMFLGLSMAAWVLGSCYGKTSECRNQTTILLSLVALVIFLFVIKGAAVAEAKTMANFVWSGNKAFTVPVITTPHSQEETYSALAQCGERRGLRQIIGFPDRMYVLCRDKYFSCERGRMFMIFTTGVIVYSSLRIHKTKPGEDGCEK
jgi:hypothetical protein